MVRSPDTEDAAGQSRSNAPSSESSLSVVLPPPITTNPFVTPSEEVHPSRANNTTAELDFIGTSHVVKQLFAAPYLSEQPLRIAVHNIDGTLIVDDASSVINEEEIDQRKDARDKVEQKDSLALAIPEDRANGAMLGSLSRLIENINKESESERSGNKTVGKRPLHLTQDDCMSSTMTPCPREYVPWRFGDMNLLVGSSTVVVQAPSSAISQEHEALTIRIEDINKLRALLMEHNDTGKQKSLLPEVTSKEKKPSYAQVLQNQATHASTSTPENVSRMTSPFPVLDRLPEPLQTCVVPVCGSPTAILANVAPDVKLGIRETHHGSGTDIQSPVNLVIDAYLDNLIANVPQLALCLQEKGFIQSIKLLNTNDIPSMYMHPAVLDVSQTISKLTSASETDAIFSPQVMEMNAATLLRFLKANCTSNNTTYLISREAGETSVRLFDVSTISKAGQRQWMWWLATMSYRFALRLSHFEKSLQASPMTSGRRRAFRDRQRSLYSTALDILQDINDMGGRPHESLVASIYDHMADSYLMDDRNDDEYGESESQEPYSATPVDALNKAQDFLSKAIKSLLCVVVDGVETEKKALIDKSGDRDLYARIGRIHEAALTQLSDLHYKSVNILLRLTNSHLQTYFSSSAMQTLRNAARSMADFFVLCFLKFGASCLVEDMPDQHKLVWERATAQYCWLWRLCGQFARSFASDSLWRDRGHASGDDIISVIRDVQSALFSDGSRILSTDSYLQDWRLDMQELLQGTIGTVVDRLRNEVDLYQLSGILAKGSGQSESGVEAARRLMADENVLKRDKRRVLVASSVSFSYAVSAYESTFRQGGDCIAIRQQLGDACNEVGMMLLGALRSLLSSDDATSFEAAEDILSSARFWFGESLHNFKSCEDRRNMALVYCNICQCHKLNANAHFATGGDISSHDEDCLQKASETLQQAHVVLGLRESDPPTWDMVSNELASTYLVLAVRRRQSLFGGMPATPSLPVVVTPGQERSIVDPLKKACWIYQQCGDLQQAASVHYQLALTFSRLWTSQRDEAKMREKLSAAFENYRHAHAYFYSKRDGNEITFILLCLDLASLYATVSGEMGLVRALGCCLDATGVIDFDFEKDCTIKRMQDIEWTQKLATVSSSLEDRAFKLLRDLSKIEDSSSIKTYLSMYRSGLAKKMEVVREGSKDPASQVRGIFTVLECIREGFDCLQAGL